MIIAEIQGAWMQILMIGTLAIAIACLGIARYFIPGAGALLEGAGVYVSLAIVALLLVSFVVAMNVTRHTSTRTTAQARMD